MVWERCTKRALDGGGLLDGQIRFRDMEDNVEGAPGFNIWNALLCSAAHTRANHTRLLGSIS